MNYEVDRELTEVHLLPGGAIEVDLRGHMDGVSGELRVYSEGSGGSPACVPVTGAGTFVLDGLPVGRSRVTVGQGRWFDKPESLAEATVVVVAGETTRVDLDLRPAEAARTYPADGIVQISSEWSIESLAVDMIPSGSLGVMRRDVHATGKRRLSARDGVDEFSWAFSSLEAGRYHMSFEEVPHTAVIDIPPGGITGHLVQVPDPCLVQVTLLNANTRLPVKTDGLKWYAPPADGGGSGWSMDTIAGDSPGDYLLTAAAGPIMIGLNDLAFREVLVDAVAQPDMAPVVLECVPMLVVSVELRDADGPVLFPDDWRGKARAAAGTLGHVGNDSHGFGTYSFQVDQPGLYLLDLPRVPGYTLPAVADIEVGTDSPQVHVVELLR